MTTKQRHHKTRSQACRMCGLLGGWCWPNSASPFSLSSTLSPLPLCKMNADVADKGDAGWEFTLSADCGLRTENARAGVQRRRAAIPALTHL